MRLLLICSVVCSMLLAACLPGDDGEEATQTPIIITPTPLAVAPTATAESTPTSEPTATEEPTATMAATATSPATTTIAPPPTSTVAPDPTATQPTQASGDLEILQLGYGQAAPGEEVGWGFIVQNNNLEMAIENTDYVIVFFDADGVVIDSDENSTPLIFPGQRTGFAGSLFVDDGISVASIEVQVTAGDPTTVEVADGFPVESTTYFPDDSFPRATGLVNNPTGTMVTDLRVSAITFDAEGNINGGGFTFLSMAQASSQTGVDVSVTSGSDVGSVELFANISYLSDAITPDPATDAVVAQFGFGQPEGDNNLGWGALIQNPSADPIRNSEIFVWFQDAEGRVLDADTNFIDTLPPSQTIGLGDDFIFLPDGTTATTMSVLIRSGSHETTDLTAWFTTENATYVPDDFFPQVTGIVNNPFPQDYEDLWVSAIGYDEAGNIIGGGSTFVDFAIANGSTGAAVSITTSGVPARVELYAYPSSLTDF